MPHALKQQLSQLKHAAANPRPEWLRANRALLVAQIKNTLSPGRLPARQSQYSWTNLWAVLSIFLPRRVVYAVIRPIAILLIVVVVATSSWVVSVDAAYEALPGDLLYPAKRATEKTQVAVARLLGGNQGATKLHIEFAKRRAVEVKKILTHADDPKKVQKASATVADLKDEIKTVSEKLDHLSQRGLSSEVVKDVKQNAEQINNVLQDVKLTLAATSTLETKAVSQEVSETKDLVKDVSVKAVAAMVTKHLAGDPTVTSDEAKRAIDTTLEAAASEAGESKQNVDGAKTMVDNVKSEIKGLASEIKRSDLVSATTTTQQVADRVTQVANQTVAAVLKSEVVSAAVDKKVIEAKEFLSSGDFTKAVDKLKEVTEASKEAEKISDNTVEKAQTVLPMVQVIKGNVAPSAVTSSPDKKDEAAVLLPPLLSGTVTGTAIISSTAPFR